MGYFSENNKSFHKPKSGSFWSKFFIYWQTGPRDVQALLESQPNFERESRFKIFLIGVLLTPITLAGALLGYVRAFNRVFAYMDIPPKFYPMRKITRLAMIIGAILIWLLLIVLILIFLPFILFPNAVFSFLTAYLVANAIFSGVVFATFTAWQSRINRHLHEKHKFGSARFADEYEVRSLKKKNGYYIGNERFFNDRGHILLTAGTRGGKGTNIILPNLLGAGKIETSWVVIDPKGENTAISAPYQRSIGQNVVVLNPWDLLAEHTGEAQSYNPLDMLTTHSQHLVDDVQVIAEMIVPIESGSSDKFWTDSARTVITGLLLHLVTSQPKEKQTLTLLWEWARYYGDDWDKLIQDMAISNDPINGFIIKNASREILKLSAAGEETFGGIVSSVLQATDFLKSPALQESLKSGFDPKVLVDGKTTVYVIIPADKLRSHGRWLRLVVTSMMRAVIRRPNKRVTFLLDEFSALGYLPEIETALSTYAGYNMTVIPILQSLNQLQNLYNKNWESFIANCTIRLYFTINDNFSADYISKAMGETSYMDRNKAKDGTSNKRMLITPDELRRASGNYIFMFAGDLPPTYVQKLPYYLVPELNKRAGINPYHSNFTISEN